MHMQLKPCPFCGCAAEIDTNQRVRNIDSAEMETAISVYCTVCTASVTVCRRDAPEIQPETVAATWNRRTPQPARIISGASVTLPGHYYMRNHSHAHWTVLTVNNPGISTGLRSAQFVKIPTASELLYPDVER